jgi:hypothetical protein
MFSLPVGRVVGVVRRLEPERALMPVRVYDFEVSPFRHNSHNLNESDNNRRHIQP